MSSNLENTNNMKNNMEKQTLYSLKGIFHSQLLSMELIKHDTRNKMMHMLKTHPQGNPEWTTEQILKLADDNKILWVKGSDDPTEHETYKKEMNARLAEILRTVPDIDKAFGYMDTVTFREGDKKGVEYFVTGYEKDGRVNIENRNSSLSVFQEKLKLVKNGILFQKDDIVKFTEDAKYDHDFVKPHYLPNTNHFRVMGVSRNDGTLRIGNPSNCKDDGCECIQIIPSQLELVTKKIQIRKMHGSEDTEITLDDGTKRQLKQQFIIAKTTTNEISFNNLEEAEKTYIGEAVWFSLDQIKTSEELIYPISLKKYLPDIIKENYPKTPIDIKSVA